MIALNASRAHYALRQFDANARAFDHYAGAVRGAIDGTRPKFEDEPVRMLGLSPASALVHDRAMLHGASMFLLDHPKTPSPVMDAAFGTSFHWRERGSDDGILASWIDGRTTAAKVYNYASPHSDADALRVLDDLTEAVHARRPQLAWQRYVAHAPIPVPAMQRGSSGTRLDLTPRPGVDPAALRPSIAAVADASDRVVEARRRLDGLIDEEFHHATYFKPDDHHSVTFRDRRAVAAAFDQLSTALRGRHRAQQELHAAGGSVRPDQTFHAGELAQLDALKQQLDVPKGWLSRHYRVDGNRINETRRWAVDTTPDEQLSSEARALLAPGV